MTGFAFAYAVVRVCGGQPRKNPGAPKIEISVFAAIQVGINEEPTML